MLIIAESAKRHQSPKKSQELGTETEHRSPRLERVQQDDLLDNVKTLTLLKSQD